MLLKCSFQFTVKEQRVTSEGKRKEINILLFKNPRLANVAQTKKLGSVLFTLSRQDTKKTEAKGIFSFSFL